ncbi:glycosyltransferase family 4 protein [Intestinibacter bartlettii]|uniref:glycosyltransferase family 4 protein n=1 Tax=Intestinibacter bartlettii TaxID=261299 RepID=UPI0022E8E2CF|nr:glycosyltransferase family 4 protein [Intestinibacter bartlettii]
MKKKPTDRLKIAMLGHKRIPSREGGVEIVVEELATRMFAQGHEVTCYNRRGNHVSGKEFNANSDKVMEHKGIKLKSVPTIEKKGLAAMSSSFFAAVASAIGKYDVVHFHAEGPCAMLWLPKLFGKKCIATVHGLDHQRSKWGKFAKAYIMLGEKVAVKFADEIIVLSEGVQNYFEEKYGRETKFIPNGVNRSERVESELIIDKYGLHGNDYLCFLARIVPEKGLTYLIDAFKQVKTDKKLVIAGGSSDTDDFAQELMKRAKGDDRIVFTGFVQGQILEELYSNAYLYTLPSDLEGMPLSLLEAMSYGNCCIVSDIAECAEVVEDKAIVFKKSNVEDLRQKIQELCDNPKIVQKYKKDAMNFICNKYNWDKVVRSTLELYR